MNSPFRFRFFLLGLLGFILMGNSSPLSAQTWGQRISLRDALNAAKDDLPSTSGFAQIDLSDPAFGIESLQDDFSGCRELRPGEELWVSYLEPFSPEHIVVSHIIQPESTIDVPTDSHLLVCHLNEWLNHAWVGPQTRDSGIAAYLLDGNCSDVAACPDCQHYYMGPLRQLAPWIWFLPSKYTVRMGSGPLPYTSTVAKIIRPDASSALADLIFMENQPTLMAYRKPPGVGHEADPDTVIQQRAHFKLVFDYTKNPYDPDWEYALPTGTYPESGWTKKRLKSVEMIFQDRSYSPDACPPPGSIDPDYDPSVAKAIVKIEFNEGGTTKTWERTVTSADEGKNSSVEEGNEWLWKARDWNHYMPRNWMKFDIDEHGYLFLTATDKDENEETFWSVMLASPESPVEYCSSIFPIDGTFCVDNMNGNLIYVPDPEGGTATCPPSPESDPIPLTCVPFCERISGYRTVDNVLAASARTFADQWEYDPASEADWFDPDGHSVFDGAADNVYQRGRSGKWRPKQEFVYRSKIKPGTVGNKVYDNSGIFVDNSGNPANAFRLFDWTNESANAQTAWLDASTVTQYAPSGEAVEEHNILDIFSAAKLAHEDIVAGIVAANAEYESIGFESFEERKDVAIFTSHLSSAYAHSGKKSYELMDDPNLSPPLLSFTVTDQIRAEGLLLKLWVKRTYGGDPPTGEAPFKVKVGATPFVDLSADGMGTLQPELIHRIAQTGEWTLYQLITKNFAATDVGMVFEVKVTKNISGQSAWVDDVRLQPLDAQATCYVYDPNTLRLLTQFDDQHFGVYYQYNGEGKLVRTLRETERGLMTVAETQYHSFMEDRPSSGTSGPGPDLPSSIHYDNPSELTGPSGTGGSGAGFDLLNLNVGKDGASLNILGAENPSLTDLQWLRDLAPPGVNSDALRKIAPNISELEKIELVKELIEIDRKRAEFADQIPGTADAKLRAELESRMNALNERRDQILRDKLGMSQAEVEQLYGDLKREQRGEEEGTDEGSAK